MRTIYSTILMLAMAAVFSMGISVTAFAEEKTENVWEEEKQRPAGQMKSPYKSVDWVLKKLAEKDQEKAKELTKLREQNPEKFKDEFQKVVHEMFERDTRRREGRSSGQQKNRADRRRGGRGQGWEQRGPQMRKNYEDYLKWLEGNYPEDANRLSELREGNPELYWRRFRLSMKKYGKIAEAAKENPALAEVLKENLKLNHQRRSLLRQIKKASDKEKTELVKELKDVLNKKFDLIVKRKQLEYEQLAKKLEELKKEVKSSEEKFEKWKDPDFKNKNVEARLKKLLGKQEDFKWE